MEIKLLTYKDYNLIDEIAYLQFEQWGHLWANNSLDGTSSRILARTNQTFLPLTIVILKQEKLQGFACVIPHGMWNYWPHYQPWLDSVYVKKEHREQGVGYALVQHAHHIAKQLKYKELFLYTPNKEHFYQQIGWTVIERLHYELEFVTVMRKEL